MSGLSIGVDLDGVVHEFHSVVRRYAQRYFDRELPEQTVWATWEEWGITEEQWVQMIATGLRDGVIFWQGSMIPGSRAGLSILRDLGCKVTIITDRRPRRAAEIARFATYKWLSDHVVPHDDLIISGVKTGRGFDLLVDDSPAKVAEAQLAGERVLVFDQPWNRHLIADRAHDWAEVVRYVRSLIVEKAAA